MDSDVIVMDDPYKYFKHPPFQHITVLNQAESPTSPNGGLLYVQNAAPDGPAAFMLAGITSLVPFAREQHNLGSAEQHNLGLGSSPQ